MSEFKSRDEFFKYIMDKYSSEIKDIDSNEFNFFEEINKKVEQIEKDYNNKISVSENCLNTVYNYKRKR